MEPRIRSNAISRAEAQRFGVAGNSNDLERGNVHAPNQMIARIAHVHEHTAIKGDFRGL